jgi:hypothetical protein
MTYQKQVYDLYGIKESDLDRAKVMVEQLLGITLEPHQSAYLGSYFRWGRPYGKEIILQSNFNQAEEDWSEGDFKDFPLLLYVNKHETPDLLQRTTLREATEIEHLRREEI